MSQDAHAATPWDRMTVSDETPIRYLGDLQRLEMKPGDIFVLMCPQPISQDMAERIRDRWEREFPSTKCIVLSDGMRLGLVDGAALEKSG